MEHDIEIKDEFKRKKVYLLLGLLFEQFQWRHFILPGDDGKEPQRREAVRVLAKFLLGPDTDFEELC